LENGQIEESAMISKQQQGKRNRAAGSAWERKVREYLNIDGWCVSKFQSNVDIAERKLIPAKSNRFLARSTGFPDFICWKRNDKLCYDVIGVECKINGYISKEERDKMFILKELGVFSKIFIARKCKKNAKTIFPMYTEFETKEWKTSMY
jgi:hypothetical protein